MSFTVVSGVCRPQTFETLEIFKSIQREANRILDSMGKDLIFVDGRIGSKTIDAVNTTMNGGFTNCSEIANKAKSILAILKQQADARQLAVVADPESVVRSVVSPPSTFDSASGQVINPSPGIMGVPLWLVAVVAAGGGYYLYASKDKKKKPKKPRKKRRKPKMRITRTVW